MRYTQTMLPRILCSKAQAMAEAAFAIPILILLFAGCVQLLQIGVAHIVVMVAAYESGRQVALDQGKTDNARALAQELCRAVSSGPTEFDADNLRVTHHLKAIFPVIKEVKITHDCPVNVFLTQHGDGLVRERGR